jgi:hypothetical protein
MAIEGAHQASEFLDSRSSVLKLKFGSTILSLSSLQFY